MGQADSRGCAENRRPACTETVGEKRGFPRMVIRGITMIDGGSSEPYENLLGLQARLLAPPNYEYRTFSVFVSQYTFLLFLKDRVAIWPEIAAC